MDSVFNKYALISIIDNGSNNISDTNLPANCMRVVYPNYPLENAPEGYTQYGILYSFGLNSGHKTQVYVPHLWKTVDKIFIRSNWSNTTDITLSQWHSITL